MKVTRRGRRAVLPRTEAANLRVLEKEKRKRARKELLNFYAWQHRESKMERKRPSPPRPTTLCQAQSPVLLGQATLGTDCPTDSGFRVPAAAILRPFAG